MNLLSGKTFSREIMRDGSFGQPKGKGYHQVSFKNDRMCDNANTFFGKPPTNLPYKVNGNEILVAEFDEPEATKYTIDGDTIRNNVGAILHLN